MSQITEITSLTHPGLEVYAQLTQSQLRNRLEPSMGIFIAESPKVIALALDAGCIPVSLLMERRHLTGQGKALMERCGEIPVYTGERELLSRLTGYPLTRGILCAMRRPQQPELSSLCSGAKRLAVLENITDSTNVGAIFRSAAAMHIDGVLVTPSCCDPLCRRAVRVSMGTVFQIPCTTIGENATEWPEKGLAQLQQMGFTTVALALSDTAVSIEDPRLMDEKKLAIVLGTEGDGLCAQTIAGCDYTAKIPMSHHVDSLNVAAAAAVAFWQLRVR